MKNVLLIVVSLIVGIGMAELCLRYIGFNQPNVAIADPILGNFRRPNQAFIYTQEGDALVSINSFGLRDREHSLEKADSTYRIAVLGDSYTEAYQVNREESFSAILESRLSDCQKFGNQVEVLNFGVSGYGTGQELLMLEHLAWKFNPDLILLAFLTGNDIRNNSRALEPEKVKPFFDIGKDGELIPDNRFLQEPAFVSASGIVTRIRNALDAIRVVQLISQVRQRVLGQVAALNNNTQESIPGAEAGLDSSIYLKHPDAQWAHAWRITEEILARIHTEVRKRNREFLVVTLSNGIQVHPDPQKTAAYMRTLSIDDIFEPDRRISEFGLTHDFAVLTLAPLLQVIARKQGVFLHGFENSRNLGSGHWNQNGHRAAAGLITDYLCARPAGI